MRACCGEGRGWEVYAGVRLLQRVVINRSHLPHQRAISSLGLIGLFACPPLWANTLVRNLSNNSHRQQGTNA